MTIPTRWRRPLRSITLAAIITITAACSNGDSTEADQPDPAPPASVAAPTTNTDTDTVTDTVEAIDDVQADPATDSRTTTPVRIPDNPRVDLGGFNIGVREMTSTAVSLWWTSVGDDSVHRVHRIAAGGDPMTVEITGASLVYEGPDTVFVDTGAAPGQFWTYVLEIDVGDTTADRRAWTTALTIDDVTPPTPIEDLVAEVTPEGVLLTWSASDDDVEFGAYAVLLVGEDGEATYLGGGTEPEQSSFLDDRPITGSATYLVQAADFHDNRTSATVDIVVP